MDSSKAAAAWDKANTKQIVMKLQRRTDHDILELLGSLDNKQGYIKQLIRDDMTGARVYTRYARIEQTYPGYYSLSDSVADR